MALQFLIALRQGGLLLLQRRDLALQGVRILSASGPGQTDQQRDCAACGDTPHGILRKMTLRRLRPRGRIRRGKSGGIVAMAVWPDKGSSAAGGRRSAAVIAGAEVGGQKSEVEACSGRGRSRVGIEVGGQRSEVTRPAHPTSDLRPPTSSIFPNLPPPPHTAGIFGIACRSYSTFATGTTDTTVTSHKVDAFVVSLRGHFRESPGGFEKHGTQSFAVVAGGLGGAPGRNRRRAGTRTASRAAIG